MSITWDDGSPKSLMAIRADELFKLHRAKRQAAAEWAREHGLTAELFESIVCAISAGELKL